MELFESKHGDIPLIRVRGDVDHFASPELIEATDRALAQSGDKLALDLSDTPYMDSGGIAVLLSLLNRLRKRGWLAVIAPNEDLVRIFDIVGLTMHEAFHVVPSVEQLPS